MYRRTEYPIPVGRTLSPTQRPISGASSGAPPQTPEFNALVPGWPCGRDICDSLIRPIRGELCQAYSKEAGWPKAREAVRPRFQPSEGHAIKGPVTIVSPDSEVNLTKNAFDGAKDRGALQLG